MRCVDKRKEGEEAEQFWTLCLVSWRFINPEMIVHCIVVSGAGKKVGDANG